MNRLAQDLLRWEAGDLNLTEVETAHPGAEPRALADLYVHLTTLRDEPGPDPAASWNAVRDRLADRPAPVRDRTRRRIARPAALALAAVLATGTVAYAAGVEPVRRVVDGAWDAVTDLFDGGPELGPIRDGGRTAGPGPRAGLPTTGGERDETAGGSPTNQQVQASGGGSHQDEAADEDHDGSPDDPNDGKGGGEDPGTVQDQDEGQGNEDQGGEVDPGDDGGGSDLEQGSGDEEAPPEEDAPPDGTGDGSGSDRPDGEAPEAGS
jgi:hypothetical protein